MAAASASSQINARIDADLKERGNRGLLRAGYTPARAIRQLWTIAAEHENEPEVVERLLASTDSIQAPQSGGAENERIEALHQGWGILQSEAGDDLHISTAETSITDEELREAAALERLAEYDRFNEIAGQR